MKRMYIAAILVLFTCTLSAATTANNDSCDISTLPAATLLLPYFEVDINASPAIAMTTLFTVVNTTQYPQIAHVTLWTDLGYPILTFNLFLTGYDAQSINLYDVLARAVIAPPNGTSFETGTGARSLPNDSNPGFLKSVESDCFILAGPLPAPVMPDIRSALTFGTISSCGTAHVGMPHANAIGYATIDVVRTCSYSLPTSAAYFDDLLYDNVLTGDYEILSPNAQIGNYAGGNPLVHIRAVPGLPYTFYDHITPRATPAMDRRQPLPATFAARFIQGGPTAFNTNFQIWREGVTGSNAACADYQKNLSASTIAADVVRFDEHENPSVLTCPPILCAPPYLNLPLTSSSPTFGGSYPPTVSSDLGGWMYLNLNHGGTRRSQNWVSVSMYAEGRFATLFDATALANGCTP